MKRVTLLLTFLLIGCASDELRQAINNEGEEYKITYVFSDGNSYPQFNVQGVKNGHRMLVRFVKDAYSQPFPEPGEIWIVEISPSGHPMLMHRKHIAEKQP